MPRRIKVINGKVKTTIRLPEEIYWRFQEAVVERKIGSDEAAYTDAVSTWADTTPQEGAPGPLKNGSANLRLGDSPLPGKVIEITSAIQSLLDAGKETDLRLLRDLAVRLAENGEAHVGTSPSDIDTDTAYSAAPERERLAEIERGYLGDEDDLGETPGEERPLGRRAGGGRRK